MVAWEDQREHDYGVFGALFGRPEADQASSCSGALHDCDGGAIRSSWSLQEHLASAFTRGVQRNVDESRGAAVDR